MLIIELLASPYPTEHTNVVSIEMPCLGSEGLNLITVYFTEHWDYLPLKWALAVQWRVPTPSHSCLKDSDSCWQGTVQHTR